MKWLSAHARHKKLQEWHIWYAWRPIKIDETWYWFEHIRRRGNPYNSFTILERFFQLGHYYYEDLAEVGIVTDE